VIYESGADGIVVDAIGFDANHGILYYVGFTNEPALCLYAIPVRDDEFSFSRTTLITTGPFNNITSVNYDNVNDLIFALNATFDTLGNYSGSGVVEIDKTTGEVIVRAELVEFPYFLAGSSSFDQNSGSLLLVGFDTNFVESMIVFDTYDNTYETGFVPGSVSEIVCDNSAFALANYTTTTIKERGNIEFTLFPNPAATSMKISNTGVWSEDILISIYNIYGGLIMQQSFNYENTVELDLSSLKTGTYLLKLVSGEVVETRKIIIR